MNEADLKRALVKELNKLSGVFAFRVELPTMIGIPDILANRPPYAAWLEVKYHRPGSKWRLTERQQLLLERLRGFLVTYVQERDGEKWVQVEEYPRPGAISEVTAERGWLGAHKHVARVIAIARLRY